MIRKDIEAAWNLLHIIESEPRKIAYYAYKLYTKYGFRISEKSLSQIVSMLVKQKLVSSKQNTGIWKGTKPFITLRDVAITLQYNFGTHRGPTEDAAKDLLEVYRKHFIINENI